MQTSLRKTFVGWIDRAEAVLQTDMRYLIRGGSWLSFNQILTSLLAFLLSLAFANLLDPATYGLYKYILALIPILAIPTLSGIDIAANQAVARGFEGTVMQGMRTKLVWGIGTVVAGIAVGTYYILHGNTVLGWSLIIIGIGTPLSEAFDIYNSILTGRADYRQYTIYNLLTQFLFSLGMLFAILSHSTVVMLIAAYVVLNVLLNLFFLIVTLRRDKPNKEIDPKSMAFGKHLTVVDIVGTILGQLDKILVFHFLGAVDLAIYSIALAPPEQLKGALKNIQFLAMPKFASREKEAGKEGLFRKTFYFCLVVTLIVIGYILIAPFFFKLLFPKYVAAVPYSDILALSIIGTAAGTFLYTFLEAHAATKQIYQYNIVNNIFNFAILVPLIYYFGLWGAVWARFLSRFGILATSMFLVERL